MVGHGSEGAKRDKRNSAGPGSDVQGGGAVSAIICQYKLGGDRVYAQGPDGVPPSGGTTDHGNDGKTRSMRRVGVPIGTGDDGSRMDPPHRGVHQEAEDEYVGEGGLPPRLCTVHGGRADSGDDLAGAMVGSRHGK